jgi:hypothetical protein
MIAMKSIFAILALSLMLAAVFSGCVGGDNAGDNNGGIDNGTGDNSGTGNETGGNETGNQTLPANYHKEYEDAPDIGMSAAHDFPVKQSAKSFSVKVTVSGTIPDPGVWFYTDVYLYNAKGEEVAHETVGSGEVLFQVTSAEIASNGYGSWNIELLTWDVITATTIIDVIYQ